MMLDSPPVTSPPQAGSARPRILSVTGAALVLAGLAWIARGLGDALSSEDYTACNSAFGYGMNAADTVGLLAIALALLGLWVAFGKSASTWLGLTAVIAAAGFALAGITNLAEHCLGQSPELPLPLFTGLAENSPYILGLVLALFIFPFAMILTRTSSAPRWSGWMLFIGAIAFWAFNKQGGLFVCGASWLILGTYLLSRGTTDQTGRSRRRRHGELSAPDCHDPSSPDRVSGRNAPRDSVQVEPTLTGVPCSRLDGVSRWYRFMYRLGFHPWEDDTESQLTQLRSLLERIEDGCDSSRRKALDLGCGTGRYAIELAKRGWDVVGVDVVPKAVELARQRAGEANVAARFVEGDVTDLEHAGVGDGFRLFLDAECFNHLNDDQRIAFGRGVDAVAGPEAEMLILVWRRAHRGPLPPGASRDDLARSFPSWTIMDDFEYKAALPLPLKRIEPRWYLLART